tara:strand:+ start:550 stop:732 length:183 start_codon:yes stop_codon:yes gene_type:complete
MEHIKKLTNIITTQEEKIKELTGKSQHYEAKCFELIEDNNRMKDILKKIHNDSRVKPTKL